MALSRDYPLPGWRPVGRSDSSGRDRTIFREIVSALLNMFSVPGPRTNPEALPACPLILCDLR